MNGLTIENFIEAADDFELGKYKVLAGLKKYFSLLHKNKLYPTLSELIELGKIINELLSENDEFRNKLPSINKSKKESAEFSDHEITIVMEIINWAAPKIIEAIDEGRAIYDFVEKNISIENVGILPLYRSEGYFKILNSDKNKIHVYRYNLNMLSKNVQPYLTFQTNLIDSYLLSDSEFKYPELLKLDLAKKFPELPNPVLYKIETEIDFPFIETVLPVAKRKLVQHLAA